MNDIEYGMWGDRRNLDGEIKSVGNMEKRFLRIYLKTDNISFIIDLFYFFGRN